MSAWRNLSLACPFFMPISKLERGSWPHPARLPLGCGWSGHCTAPGHEGETPPQEVVESSCNLGYASHCSWVPSDRTWDAVRFATAAPAADGGGATRSAELARELYLIYVCERDHRPLAHGQLLFDLSKAAWIIRHDDLRIQKMAECFLDSYLKKKPQGS